MRRLLSAVILILCACAREDAASVTNTIEPADPMPAKTVTEAADNRRMITTTGSPPPPTLVATGTEAVRISAKGIENRVLLPRGQTAFRIDNATAVAHDLKLRADGLDLGAAVVPPNGSAVLQTVLDRREYEIVCTTNGHSERSAFKTYAPGEPLRRSGR